MLGTREHLKLVDTEVLHRKIELVNDLKHFRWLLREGPTGGGRSRFGLALLSGVWPWAEDYPYNAFLAPVVIQEGADPAGLVQGLLQGHLRHILDAVRLLRRARLEAAGKYHPEVDAPWLAALTWDDLDEAERKLATPLLLVGNQRLLDEVTRSGLSDLLASSFPVKVLILDDAVPPANGDPARHFSRQQSVLAAAASLGNAFVFRGSLAAPAFLFDGLRRGIHHSRPALYHVFAPDPDRHVEGVRWPDLASLAMNTRAFPFFVFDPDAAGGFLSSAIDLGSNPAPDAEWVSGEENPAAVGNPKPEPGPMTLADWLLTLRDWQVHFQPVDESVKNPVDVAAYLAMESSARPDKTPVVYFRNQRDGAVQPMTVSARAAAMTGAARRQWNTLRELAGRLTPFPQKLRLEVERELGEKYEQELEALRATYEGNLQHQEAELMQAVRMKLRDNLLALAKQKEK